jgi:hypothetical protein
MIASRGWTWKVANVLQATMADMIERIDFFTALLPSGNC